MAVLTTRSLVLLGITVIALVALVPTINAYVTQQQQLSRMQSQVALEEERVSDLEAEVARWEDPTFVASQARERLLFAMPGETQYRLTDSSGNEVPMTEAQQAEARTSQPSWFGSLWESLVASSQASPPADTAPESSDPPQ